MERELSQREREAIIGVAPYGDGSGYPATVKAYTEGGQVYFEIDITHRLEAEHWPALRKAVDDALALAFGSTK